MQEVAHGDDHAGRIILVGCYIHAVQVGDELLIAIRFGIKDQAAFLLLPFPTIPSCGEEESEFQRHIEAWEVALRVELNARQVMNPVPAFSDDPI